MVFQTLKALFFSFPSILDLLKVSYQIKVLSDLKGELERENLKLRKRYLKVISNPQFYKEVYLREFYQMQRPNEIIIIRQEVER